MSDTVLDKLRSDFHNPPSAQLLGWEFVELDPEAQTMTVAFEGKEAFYNPFGVVQGGILSAMIDDTMGPMVGLLTGGQFAITTTDLHVTFHKGARAGRLVCKARAIRLGRTVASAEGELFDEAGDLVARGISTIFLRPRKDR